MWDMDADALVRAAGNVAHVHKKNPNLRSVLFTLSPGGLTILGGDPYAAAHDTAPVESCTAARGLPVVFELPREGLDAVTSFCRQHAKQTIRLEWFPGDGLVMACGASRESVEDGAGLTPPAAWQALEGLFERYEDPRSVFVLDMGLASRFRLVKSDKNERRAAWMIRDPEEPILVKVGPSFRGLMMPINSEVHAEAVGQEGLW
jgi:hypothetical protein